MREAVVLFFCAPRVKRTQIDLKNGNPMLVIRIGIVNSTPPTFGYQQIWLTFRSEPCPQPDLKISHLSRVLSRKMPLRRLQNIARPTLADAATIAISRHNKDEPEPE